LVQDLLLPEHAVLLHIGPHKTGTTAVQSALREARPVMAEHGVVYAGRERQHWLAALAVTGGKGLWGEPPAQLRYWRRLVQQVAAASDKRVVVSSEFFDDADDDTVRKIVAELGGQRVHILVTLRPLANILPSAWQQYVRNRLRSSYEEWLDAMFNNPPFQPPTVTFWQRHQHDVLIGRWASVVGPDNVTVVISDPSDRQINLRTIEKLVGLPDGLLVPEEHWTNRSLTLGETELVRHLNQVFNDRDWPPELYRNVVREGVVMRLQTGRTPEPDEPRAVTPGWALERAAERGAAAAEKIKALGVRIVGDISVLGAPPKPQDPNTQSAPAGATLPAEAAAEAVVATILGMTKLPTTNLKALATPLPTSSVNSLTSKRLTSSVVRRVKRRLRENRHLV
jgi:hypothetical protein